MMAQRPLATHARTRFAGLVLFEGHTQHPTIDR
jgi:hypothetical protein